MVGAGSKGVGGFRCFLLVFFVGRVYREVVGGVCGGVMWSRV